MRASNVHQSFRLDGDWPIATRGSRTLTAADLRVAATAIGNLLPAEADGHWCISIQSPFLLLAALAALQSAGATPLLLPHTRPSLLSRLSDSCRGFLSDEKLALNLAEDQTTTSIVLPDLEILLADPRRTEAFAEDWLLPVGFMTSGSSGEPAPVFKTPAQLIAEIELLESAFGDRISPERTFCGTTSHQHLFGFTFRVIWPLLTGRRLADAQIRIPGEVGASIRRHGQIVLIASPAFLERAATLMDKPLLKASQLLGFSSGGPLDPALASDFNQIEDVALIEIYGSTETGALAWRVTEREPAPPWHPLPEVSIRIEDGHLSVSAPHQHAPGFQLTEDMVESAANGFQLKGRRDQVVKVADKRVNLTELNGLIDQSPSVSEGRVIQLEDGTLAGILVPSEAGWKKLAGQGKRVFCGSLREHLAESVDRVTTPKRWRIIRQLPRNTQGKVEHALLLMLFQPLTVAPQWLMVESGPERWLGSAQIAADLLVLEGHFPGDPVVPGVALLHWAATVARDAFGIDHLTGSMQAIKFRKPILPGTTLQLSLELQEDGRQISFRYFDDLHTFSSGRLSFHDQ